MSVKESVQIEFEFKSYLFDPNSNKLFLPLFFLYIGCRTTEIDNSYHFYSLISKSKVRNSITALIFQVNLLKVLLLTLLISNLLSQANQLDIYCEKHSRVAQHS